MSFVCTVLGDGIISIVLNSNTIQRKHNPFFSNPGLLWNERHPRSVKVLSLDVSSTVWIKGFCMIGLFRNNSILFMFVMGSDVINWQLNKSLCILDTRCFEVLLKLLEQKEVLNFEAVKELFSLNITTILERFMNVCSADYLKTSKQSIIPCEKVHSFVDDTLSSLSLLFLWRVSESI